MERFCGRLLPTIKSRRHPYRSMDSYVAANAQLSLIKIKYNLEDSLSLLPKGSSAQLNFHNVSYPTCELLPPRRTASSGSLLPTLVKKIAVSLATRFNTTTRIIGKHLKPEIIEQWGKVRRLDGDTMHASSLVKPKYDNRDATFVRVPLQYDLLVDKHARSRDREPEYEPQSFYGQLENIFVVKLPATPDLELVQPATLILAAIRTCTVEAENSLDMHYYKRQGRTEVVDMTSVQCVVGRVKVGNMYAIIDRSGSMARGYYDPDDE
ncbi:hypothetical protein D9615_009129 [Tricholomella constricta]|uniref:Uncharacterized protein n=1 Tax=Tricholomella constricta TaxID=117010 RepID=A0A8H5H0H7_9AGAR|nr:hypothetical protein D9615_009129 [Tricholomella constricta]